VENLADAFFTQISILKTWPLKNCVFHRVWYYEDADGETPIPRIPPRISPLALPFCFTFHKCPSRTGQRLRFKKQLSAAYKNRRLCGCFSFLRRAFLFAFSDINVGKKGKNTASSV
jgi:hypothetical protein